MPTTLKSIQLTIALSFIFLVPSGAICQVTTAYESASKNDASLNRTRGKNMLDDIKKTLKEYYFDEKFKGIDLETRIKTAKERVDKLDMNWQIFQEIAEVLMEFDDSHTFFIPPNRSNRVSYGFSMQMVGPRCFITSVKKGSDAEAKGLKPGDQILSIGANPPSRDSLWRINYLIYSLSPQELLQVTVADPEGVQRKVIIKASFKSQAERRKEAEARRKKKVEDPFKCHIPNDEVAICKLNTFETEKKYIDRMMAEIGLKRKVILDLRGNGGGFVDTEEYLVGHFFDHDVKVATSLNRKKPKERVAKTQKGRVVTGDLIVLIDSNSASASEIFARVIQIEKRGRVLGDISAGAVMTSYMIPMQNDRGVPGYQVFSLYGLSVTVSDLIMGDGNRIEKVGVMPDQQARPTAWALRDNLDPVLAYAATQFGVNMTAEQAGKLNFLKAADDQEDSTTDDPGDGDKDK
ncbi:MAG: S41 family peptidase [Pyrinomonadaceae bacterium]